MKKVYMHTIDGKPGFFSDGQICFLPHRRAKSVLCSSLKQIKDENAKTIANRAKWGFKENDSRYSYVMFYL